MRIAAGEYADTPASFRELIRAGAVDTLQADATRCGGVTGFLNAAAQCTAAGLPLSAHTAPALHAVLGCIAQPVVHVESFHDHELIEPLLFDGVSTLVNGCLEPPRSAAGHGLVLSSRGDEYCTARDDVS
jgi:L-alanine-DL-glutamate epimerase-like enolase superfamily enzyme